MADFTRIDAYRRRKLWRHVGAEPKRRPRGMGGTLRITMLAGFGATLFLLNLRDGAIAPLVSSQVTTPTAFMAVAGPSDRLSARFGFCHSGGGTNCVVDGDTFWFQGQKIRLADIDTPETHPPRCAEEARLGAAATRRLQGLLNAGPFTLETIDRDIDSYGRALRTVTRDGASLGGVLVDEGLARWYAGGRQPWC